MEMMTLMHERAGQVFTLPASAHARQLWVLEGRAWITESRAGAGCPADLWLRAGDLLSLPPGTAWVVEAVAADLRLGLRSQPRPVGALQRTLRALSAAFKASRAHGAMSAGESMASAGARR
jgi:hypothetical protein